MLLSYNEIILRLAAAWVCGVLLGLERQRRGKPVGISTYVLISLSACSIAMLSAYSFQDIPNVGNSDPARLVVGILTGMGFLKDHSPRSIASELETALNTRLANFNTTGLSEKDYNNLMVEIYNGYTTNGEGAKQVAAFRTYETTYNSVMRTRAGLLGTQDEFIPSSFSYKPTFSNHTNAVRKFTVNIQ